jgi:hypothetical protein
MCYNECSNNFCDKEKRVKKNNHEEREYLNTLLKQGGRDYGNNHTIILPDGTIYIYNLSSDGKNWKKQ